MSESAGLARRWSTPRMGAAWCAIGLPALLMAGLVGRLGVAPAANIGSRASMFEGVHGSASDITGKGLANPCALMLAAAMMLDNLDQPEVAKRVRTALHSTLSDPESSTRDLGGSATTARFTSSVMGNFR